MFPTRHRKESPMPAKHAERYFLTVPVDQELYDAVKLQAAKEERTVVSLFRLAIKAYLEEGRALQ